ncbi:mevalonate kinase family protein [Streptomyces jumonjinensis]|uniref:Galactokinase n=1 Tax=Streptomyces jumonjinensis TaxID=1945 RepID=A0A646K9A3_STRJU|nr:galactokinase [Streptomyces jumonjinensis]MQS98752.1 galactokinase [Streptomyces jumonjinensis]
MSGERTARAVVPCRACLSGEDLDWLGGRSVSLALDLTTVVETVPGPAAPAAAGGWPGQVWGFLRGRIPGLGPNPPVLNVHSDAPAASGLSSSTALIVALFQAYTDAFAPSPGIPVATLAQWAYEFEFAHFNGGGMDHLAVIEGDALLLEGRPTGLPAVLERRAFPDDWAVVVVDSATRKDTSDHIRVVRAQLAGRDPALAAYLKEADQASADVWEAMGAGDLDGVGDAMDRAHNAMRDHQGMSTPVLEDLREAALRSAGLRLKLSGAGGGGALVGVCRAADQEPIATALRQALGELRPAARVLTTRAAAGAGARSANGEAR